MVDSYSELKSITDRVYGGENIKWSAMILELLSKNNISLRRDDGKLHSVQVSIPKSITKAIVVGLRYFKKDGTNSEDHFLFRENQEIEKCYGKRLERLLPEYKGTHKAQLVLRN